MKKYVYLIVLSLLMPNILPVDGAQLNYTHVLFEWAQIEDAESYEIQISDSNNFSNILSVANTQSLVYIEKNNIDWNNQYYWRVRGLDYEGNPGSWLESSSFTTVSKRSDANATLYSQSEYNEGITIFSSFLDYFSAAIDMEGNEIWNTQNTNLVYYTNNYGQLYGTQFSSDESELPGIKFSLDNEILWSNTGNAYVHHDFFELSNGNFMGLDEYIQDGPIPTDIDFITLLTLRALGYTADGLTNEFPWVGDKIIEWNPDGTEAWSWNAFDHLSHPQDYDMIGGSWTEVVSNGGKFDWTHANALWFSESESALYISSRNLSRIIKIDYPSGNIIWQMGLDMPSGDIDCGLDLNFSFQHSLEILDNGNILFLDNGNLSTVLNNTDYPTTRAFEIAVSETEGGCDATVVWEYALPQDLFGSFSGNVQKLNNGNYLVTTVGNGATSLEIKPTGINSGDVVWEANYNLSVPAGAIYRAHRIEGLHPIAFSIVSNNYKTEGNSNLYPIGNETSQIGFKIWNDGELTETFNYSINGETGSLEINPGNFSNITYNATIDEEINLSVTSLHRPDLIKNLSITTVLDETLDNENIPNNFILENPYPNPFNPLIYINFSLSNFSYIELNIIDVNGKLVKSLEKNHISQGKHKYSWDASDIPSGNYFVELKSDKIIRTKKVTLIK